MSLLTSLIPLPYRIVAGVALVGALVIGGRIYWDHAVQKAADVVINKYIADKVKDDAELAEVIIADGSRIKLQLITQENTITKVVVQNQTVIDSKVPDINTILSNGWVSAFNSSVQGLNINPVTAADKAPSGVNADQALDTINTNNGISQDNLAKLTSCQNWITKAQADVAAANNKNGATK